MQPHFAMKTPNDEPIQVAFNPLMKKYIFLYVAGILLITIVGIPFLIVWLLGFGQWYSRLYFEKLECELTDRNLRFKQGILFQFEKTIPLDNIQDMTFFEGPLLRRFHLSSIKIETAGHSVHNASNMSLIGVINAQEFRNAILERRASLQNKHSETTDPLTRIADKLDSIYELMMQSNSKP